MGLPRPASPVICSARASRPDTPRPPRLPLGTSSHGRWQSAAVLAALLSALTPGLAQPQAADRSLRISDNSRYLVDRGGRPFLLQGDAAWSLIVGLTKPEAEAYLRNRRAKGFNTILVNLIEHLFTRKPPYNAAGIAPFADPYDWTTVREEYFTHADWVIRKAQEYGISVLLAPVYLGYPGTKEGFIEEVLANGPERCLNYGRFLGKHYKDFDNLIWVMGGDRDPGPALENINMIAYGIREYDQRHLFTAHCHPDSWPMEQYPAPWMDFGNTYTYGIVHRRLIDDYNRTPVRPNFLMESTYEGEHNSSPAQIRRQAYWAILCGGFGHVMGNRPIWLFDPGWEAAMDAAGSTGMMHWGRFFRSRKWWDLVPDQKREIVKEGQGEHRGLDYTAAARMRDGSTVIVYTPVYRSLTIDLTKVSGSETKAWWFDPRTGQSKAAGTFPATGLQKLEPPAEGDWALVLDDAAAHLAAPGKGI